jgi:hypothetical protein
VRFARPFYTTESGTQSDVWCDGKFHLSIVKLGDKEMKSWAREMILELYSAKGKREWFFIYGNVRSIYGERDDSL